MHSFSMKFSFFFLSFFYQPGGSVKPTTSSKYFHKNAPKTAKEQQHTILLRSLYYFT